MRTEKQILASRLNGKKSSGPITAMGKDRIRSNALQHGLTERMTLWSNEDSAQFQKLLLVLLEQLAPTNDLEFLCVEEMAMAKWRMRRVVSLETAAGNKQLAEARAEGTPGAVDEVTAAQPARQVLTALRQQEAAYGRAYQRAYRHLLQLREMSSACGRGDSGGGDVSAGDAA